MHIALFGGRFDPPHMGHLRIARYILQSGFGIGEVWFIPANTHPWRSISASGKDRLAMVQLLEEKRIKALDIDIQRGGQTFTIDTIRKLQNISGNTYYWILGNDQMHNFSKWKEAEKLQNMLHFLVIPRKGTQNVLMPKNFHLVAGDYLPTNLSSSEIRDRIAKGLSITTMVPENVEAYIKKRRLYM